ncbi:hypothetical protein TMatcc_009114 [Talaromyces marneffei ATCC 18224]|uniref:Uncharacterized protein n=1 Tax=Talaromyces marneffei (strain ATCC 18224 / CBS 334.59 / QM 7333) TaxID=441960 RepID=B6QNI9_TALMQ|nr:conserved hypothetical protein [Talaromyces marneffei ATCC 18224]
MQNSIQEGTTDMGPQNNSNVVPLGSPDFLIENLRMPLLLFTDDEADTLVYIDPSPQQPGESSQHESHRWVFGTQTTVHAIPHRIHSRKLLDTGSDVLKNLFRPRNQARVRKHYGLTNEMPLGVKYAIDLTPPSEGDEAVIFMTELSCPMGVRKWGQMQSRWALPSSCVSGRDELEWIVTVDDAMADPIVVNADDVIRQGSKTARRQDKKQSKQARKQTMKQAKENSKAQPSTSPTRIMNWQGNLPTLRADLDPLPSYEESEESHPKAAIVQKEPEPPKKIFKRLPGLPLDYSPIRHRTCLERFLHAIEGLDPKLDTAPKLWTYFALAKILQVATHPAVGDHILVWLYSRPNTMFIEVNPELAYQIGCGLQNRALCQASFAILVGEESLMVLESSINDEIPKRKALTLHGRNRELLDDTEVQRVEYASKVFLDRMLNEFVNLVGSRMDWVEEVVMEDFRKWAIVNRAEHQEAIHELIDFCKLYVRCQIYQELMHQSTPNTEHRFYSNDATEYPGIGYYTARSAMSPFCRILTRGFWKTLSTSLPVLTNTNVWIYSSIKDLAPAIPNLKDQGSAIIRPITTVEVDRVFTKFHREVNMIWYDFGIFQTAVERYLDKVVSRIAGPPQYEQVTASTFDVPFDIVDTLVCLQEDEFKFLPLWAGGFDDGTGGVFDDHSVPTLEEGGFSTAGPSVHLGSVRDPDEVASMDSFESIRPDEAASTVQRASHEATDSHASTTVRSVTTSLSDFELVVGIQDLNVKSANGSMVDDDDDVQMMENGDEDGFEYFDNEYNDDDDDDDDDDTIGSLSDVEDMR